MCKMSNQKDEDMQSLWMVFLRDLINHREWDFYAQFASESVKLIVIYFENIFSFFLDVKYFCDYQQSVIFALHQPLIW